LTSSLPALEPLDRDDDMPEVPEEDDMPEEDVPDEDIPVSDDDCPL